MSHINGTPFQITCDQCGEEFTRYGMGRHPGIVEKCFMCRLKEIDEENKNFEYQDKQNENKPE